MQQRCPAVIESSDGRSHFAGIIITVAVDQLLGQASQCAHFLMPRQHFGLQSLSTTAYLSKY